MMNFLYSLLLTAGPLMRPADTLRFDGYYLKVDDQATRWYALYFGPNGRYMDTSSTGTPPVLEQGTLVVREDHRFSLVKEKKDYLLQLEVIAGNSPGNPSTQLYKCVFENEQMIIVEMKDSRGKWKKVKERYYFIPY